MTQVAHVPIGGEERTREVASGLAYPQPVEVQIEGQVHQGQLELVTRLDSQLTRTHLGEEVPTGQYGYTVWEVVTLAGQVLAVTRCLGGGIINPHVSH